MVPTPHSAFAPRKAMERREAVALTMVLCAALLLLTALVSSGTSGRSAVLAQEGGARSTAAQHLLRKQLLSVSEGPRHACAAPFLRWLLLWWCVCGARGIVSRLRILSSHTSCPISGHSLGTKQ